jgi:hypothetical protein
VRDPGVEQDALGGRGFTGINVGTDADITIPLDRSFAWHLLTNVECLMLNVEPATRLRPRHSFNIQNEPF